MPCSEQRGNLEGSGALAKLAGGAALFAQGGDAAPKGGGDLFTMLLPFVAIFAAARAAASRKLCARRGSPPNPISTRRSQTPGWRGGEQLRAAIVAALERTVRIDDGERTGQLGGHFFDAAASRDLALKLLTRLSAEDRLVLTLLDVEGFSVAEIAQMTNWSISKVKVRAHRARAHLRKVLRKYV